ncbi:hypothetical protein Fmac_016157 [Flemingia macrophylla]|uniref:Uncharacterized protein n=1 Tax=Flemingia macrophylla TaxID=520843 RepID=A0ABD1MGL2_9FABA
MSIIRCLNSHSIAKDTALSINNKRISSQTPEPTHKQKKQRADSENNKVYHFTPKSNKAIFKSINLP